MRSPADFKQRAQEVPSREVRCPGSSRPRAKPDPLVEPEQRRRQRGGGIWASGVVRRAMWLRVGFHPARDRAHIGVPDVAVRHERGTARASRFAAGRASRTFSQLEDVSGSSRGSRASSAAVLRGCTRMMASSGKSLSMMRSISRPFPDAGLGGDREAGKARLESSRV